MVGKEIFNDIPIFSLLDEEERAVLAQQVSVRNFENGSIFSRQTSQEDTPIWCRKVWYTLLSRMPTTRE